MATESFTVTGMTCSHCEMSIIEEVSEVDGVTSVTADHKTGAVDVTGEGFTTEAISNAVKEAGYELA